MINPFVGESPPDAWAGAATAEGIAVTVPAFQDAPCHFSPCSMEVVTGFLHRYNQVNRGGKRMEQSKRVCPKCGSDDYVFRGRKNIAAKEGQEEAVETRYLCRKCEHGWKESNTRQADASSKKA